MNEKSYYTKLTKYYEKEAFKIKNNIAWEAKFTRTNNLNFKCLPSHQEAYLLRAELSYGYKITDTGIAQKPFDGFALYKATSLFVAIYYAPRKTTIIEMPIRTFLKEKYESGSKSLSLPRAELIGRVVSV